MGHVFFQTLSFSGGSRFPPPWSLFLSSCPSSFSSSFVAPTFFPSFHHVTGAAQPSLPVCVIHSPILLRTHLTFPLLTIWSSLSILRKGVSGAPWIPKASDTQVFYIQRSSVMNTVCSLNPWISAPPDSPSYGQNFTLVEFADVRPMDMTHR